MGEGRWVLKVRFFSLIREALDCEELNLEFTTETVTIDDVKRRLSAQGGVDWQDVLMQPNVVHALNHRVVESSQALSDGDEIAFFPPMTGG